MSPRASSHATRTISDADAGQTVAAIVRALVPDASWNKARELCASGRVTVDGALARDGAARVGAGQVVTVDPHGKKQLENVVTENDVVFSDADVIVVRKPAGVLTCPYEDEDRGTLVDRVRSYLRRTTKSKDPFVGVVQRLDKDTTGLLVFARSMRGKRSLEAQLRAHTVLRRYEALVHAEATGEATIRSVIVQDRGDGLRGSWGTKPFHQGEPPEDGKHAVTHVRALEVLDGATRIECRLETGRQHQIRIHLAEAGHPLVGEAVYIRDYGGPRIEAPRPMLHARELGFEHPADGRKGHWEEPLPEDFQRVTERLRRR